MRILFVAALLLISLSAPEARGDLAIEIGNAQGQTNPILVDAGNTVSVSFFATPTADTNLAGFNLAIEFGQSDDGGGNSFGLGGNFARGDFSVSPADSGFSGTPVIAPDNTGPVLLDSNGFNVNYDFQISNNGSLQTFDAGETFGLFNLVIDVPENAAPGIYDVRLELDEQPFDVNANAPGNVDLSVLQGSIQVVSIPEPSCSLFLLASGLFVVRRRRRA